MNKFQRFENEIPASKDEEEENPQALHLQESGLEFVSKSTAAQITPIEKLRLNLNNTISELRKNKEEDPITKKNDWESEDNSSSSSTSKLKEGIAKYLDDIKCGIISKEKTIGSGFQELRWVRYSPDSKKIALAGGGRRSLRLYDAETHTVVWEYLNFKQKVAGIKFFEGGRTLIAASELSIRSFNVATGTEVNAIELNTKVSISAVSINERGSLVAVGVEGRVLLLNWPSGVIKKEFSEHYYRMVINAVVFSTQENYLATAGSKKIVIFDVNQEVVYKQLDTANSIYSLAFSKGDRFLASGDDTGSIKIYDFVKGNLSDFDNDANKGRGYVYDLKFSSNLQTLLSCTTKNKIHLWDLKGKGELKSTIDNQFKLGVYSVDFNHDDSKVVACSSGQMKLIDLKTNTVISYNKGFTDRITACFFNNDESKLIGLSSAEHKLKIIDSSTGDDLSIISPGNLKDGDGNDWIDDGKVFAKIFTSIVINPSDKEDNFAVFYHTYSKKRKSGIISYKGANKCWETEIDGELTCINFNNPGTKIVCIANPSILIILDANTGTVSKQLNKVLGFSFKQLAHLTGDVMILGGFQEKHEPSLRYIHGMYELNIDSCQNSGEINEESMTKFSNSHNSPIIQISKVPFKELLGSLDEGSFLIISELSSKSEKFSIKMDVFTTIFAFMSDGKRIITGSSSSISIYELEKKLKLLSLECTPTLHLNLSRAGRKLIVSNSPNILEVFRTDLLNNDKSYFGKSPKYCHKILYTKDESRFAALTSNEELIFYRDSDNSELARLKVDFAPKDFTFDREENLVVVVGNSINVYNAMNYKEVVALSLQEGMPIESVIFSSDQSKIITGCKDGAVRLYDRGLKHLKKSDFANKAPIKILRNHPMRLLEFATAGGDPIIRFFNQTNLDLIRTIDTGHKNIILSICFSLDGNMIFSAGEDNFILVNHANKEKLDSNSKPEKEFTDPGQSDRFCTLDIDPSGKSLIAFSFDGFIKVWNLITYEKSREFKFFVDNQPPIPALFSRKTPNKVLTAPGNDAYLLDIATGEIREKIIGNPSTSIYSLLPISSLEGLSNSSSPSRMICAERHILSVIDSESGEILGKINNPVNNFYNTNICFTDQFMTEIVSGVNRDKGNRELNFYDIEKFKLIETIRIPANQITEVDEDLKVLYSLNRNEILLIHKTIRIFNRLGSAPPSLVWKGGQNNTISAWAVSADKSKVAISTENIIRIISIKDKKQLRDIETFSKEISFSCISFSPNCERLYCFGLIRALGFNKEQTSVVLVIDVNSGYIIKSHSIKNEGHGIFLKGNFSPDAKSLVLCYPNQSLKILNTDIFNEAVVKDFEIPNNITFPPIFSPDSQRIMITLGCGLNIYEADTNQMTEYLILNKQLSNFENDKTELDFETILNRKRNIFRLLGGSHNFNLLHYLCLFNYEDSLERLLNLIKPDNMPIFYSLLNERDFLDRTPFQICVKLGLIKNLETLVKMLIRVNSESRLLSDAILSSETLDIILEFCPKYLNEALNGQLSVWEKRKFVELPIKQEEEFLPIIQTKYWHKNDIEMSCLPQRDGELNKIKKKDYVCQVLAIQDILRPQNSFLSNISWKLDGDDDIFDSEPLASVLEYKWRSFAKKKFNMNLLKYLIYFLLVLVGSLILFPMRDFSIAKKPGEEAPQNVDPTSTGSGVKKLLRILSSNSTSTNLNSPTSLKMDTVFLASVIVDILTVLYLFFFIFLHEVREVVIKKMGYFTESIWNLFDILLIVLGIVAMTLDLLELLGNFGKENLLQIQILKVILFFNLLFTWFRMGAFWRGFRPTAAMVRLLSRVFSEMKAFFVVLFYLLIGFAMSTFLLQSNYTEHNQWHFFKMFYKAILGDGEDYGNLSETTPEFSEFFFINYFIVTIFFIVIMLNLLISIISETFSKVTSVESKAFQLERLNLIKEYEEMMTPTEKEYHCKEIEGKYLYSIKARDTQKEEAELMKEREDIKQKQFEKIYSDVVQNTEMIRNLGETLENLQKETKSDYQTLDQKLITISQDLNTIIQNQQNMKEDVIKF